MSDFEETFQKAMAAASKSKPLPRGTRHSIGLQAEGDARTAAEGTPVVRPLPRGTSTAALRRHAGQLWHRYHRNEILTTPEMMFDYATSAARLYIKTFVAAFQAEARRTGAIASGQPLPWFRLGDRVEILGTGRKGEISFVGQYDDYIRQYRYKVKESDGTRKTWNEQSLGRTS